MRRLGRKMKTRSKLYPFLIHSYFSFPQNIFLFILLGSMTISPFITNTKKNDDRVILNCNLYTCNSYIGIIFPQGKFFKYFIMYDLYYCCHRHLKPNDNNNYQIKNPFLLRNWAKWIRRKENQMIINSNYEMKVLNRGKTWVQH